MLTHAQTAHAGKLINQMLLTIFLAVAFYATAQDDSSPAEANDYAIVELKAENMPRLNIPRSGHVVLCLNGELTVFGGHTDGFVMTPTAEYFSDGAWHKVPLVYPHDNSAILALRSGKVLLAGGHKENLGIDQLFSVELYDPEIHSSYGFGCMNKKRAFANAVEMNDGQVVVSGNWFAGDGIEMFENVYDKRRTNASWVKEVSLSRAAPYILRVSDDDAIIFSSLDNDGSPIGIGLIDRLQAPAYHESFLDTWQPINNAELHCSTNLFIGNEAEGIYDWLLPVKNDDTGEVAVARVSGRTGDNTTPTFSLLPTLQALPQSINGETITYSSLVCDRQRRLAYLIAEDRQARIYVVALSYDATPLSPFTVYVFDSQSISAKSVTPVLTPDGDLVFAGGHLESNFITSDVVVRLPVGRYDVANASATVVIQSNSSNLTRLILVFFPILIVGGLILVVLYRRREAKRKPMADTVDVEEIMTGSEPAKAEHLEDLMKRIEHIMETERLYLNAFLRASDVASRVNSNTTYVSAAINTIRGTSLSQFLASYRIKYAQELMRQNPESKISTVSTLSGFSTDATFYRAFRSVTGMSPKEWLADIKGTP